MAGRHAAAVVGGGAAARAWAAHSTAAARSSATARAGIAATAAVLTVLAAVLVPVGLARADTAPPAGTPETVSADGLPTVQIDGVAWSQAVAGNTVYVGGSFATARPAGSAPGQNTVPRPNLLSYDIRTGVLNAGWSPAPNAQIRATAVSPDGKRLYVAGDFTSIAGVARYRLAAFDTATGALITSFNAGLDAPARSLAVTNTTVYVGGGFSRANNAARSRLAAFSATNGALLPWNPRADNGTVAALAVSPDQNAVFVGGSFTSLNGSSNPGFGLARVTADTGAMLPLPANERIRNGGDKGAILGLTGDANNVYIVGYTFGREGGTFEGTAAIKWSDGSLAWMADCHGDTYSVYPHGSAVYTASHAHWCGSIGSFPQTDPPSDWTHYRATAMTKAATRTVGREQFGYTNYEGLPGPTVLNFFPDLDWGLYTGQEQGPWSVTGNSQYVAFGGEFRNVNYKAQQGLVRFAVKSVAPNKTGPRFGGSNFPIAAEPVASGAVRISWQATADPDNEALVYRVVRDGNSGSPVHVGTYPSQIWDRPAMGFTDTGLTPGGSYTYQVTATDPFGNAVSSPTVRVTANGSGTLSAYAQEVMRDGASHYWRLGESSGSTAADSAATNDGTYGSSVGRGAAGAIAGDSNRAADLGTSTNGWIQTGERSLARNYFSIETWIKASSSDRGRIVGFGSSSSLTGTSSSKDRHLYLDGQGRLNFGVYPGDERVVRSSQSYTDSRWHHVVATMGADGMRLYVDGNQVASSAQDTVGQNYFGYWRIGGDTLGGWPNQPSGDYYGGLVDEVAIYPRPMSAATVREHYQLGGGADPGTQEPPQTEGGALRSVDPARLADTRSTGRTIDGRGAGTGALGAGQVLKVPVLGRGGVPSSGVGAVVLNVTATEAVAAGYVTAWPTGTAKPNASVLNYERGQTIPNLVTVRPGADGTVSLHVTSGTHLVVDVQSWSPQSSGLTAVDPARLVDTRSTGRTVDGRGAATGALGAGEVLTVPVRGRGGVPSSGVGAVLLNVTVTEPTGNGYVTAWPTGTGRPNASVLNYVRGQTIPNLVMVRPGADGTVALHVTAGTHVVVDVQGWVSDSAGITAVNPGRLADTRSTGRTVDGRVAGTGAVATGGVLVVPVTGRAGVPASGVGTVVLNVTVTEPATGGYVTAWPTGTTKPNASVLNYVRGQTIPNLVTVRPGADGTVSLHVTGRTHLVVDVQGWSAG